MNQDTGDIRYFAKDEPIPENFTPLSKRKAHALSATAKKERSALLKQMRKDAIRRAKRLIRARLSQEEMEQVLSKPNATQYEFV